MLQIQCVIDNIPVYCCSFCQKPINHQEAIENEWKFCHHCGRELWNSYSNPWR